MIWALVAIAFALGLSAGARLGIELVLDGVERSMGDRARAALIDNMELGPWRRLFK